MKFNKILSHLLIVALSALVIVGCTKDEKQPQISKRTIKIGANKVENPSPTKTTYEYVSASKSLSVKWAAGDGLSVTYHDDDLDIDNAESFDIERGAGTKSATFVTDNYSMIDPNCVDNLYIYYPKGNRQGTLSGEYEVAYNISSQTGTLANLGQYDLMKGVALTSEAFNYDDEVIFKVDLQSYVSILRIASGTVIIPTYVSNSATVDATLTFSGTSLASGVVYKGAGAIYSGNSITVSTQVVNGALVDDLYLTFINREDATEFVAHEYKVITTIPTAPENTFEAVLTKKPSAAGHTPFEAGTLYNLTKLTLTQIGGGSYTLKYLTFEDVDYKGSDPGMIWSSLIDNPEYFGSLLYNRDPATDPYWWYDEGNTEIYHIMGDAYYWSGGEAISNYVMQISEGPDYTRQLSVPMDNGSGKGGHNGSSNFCVHFGFGSYNSTGIAFYDGVARIVDHMWVAPNSYLLNIMLNGDGWVATPLTTVGSYMKIIAIGYVGGTETGRKEFYLAKDGNIVTDWTKWSLLSLGKVDSILFDMESSDTGAYGMNQPGYFAYDDIAVRFED